MLISLFYFSFRLWNKEYKVAMNKFKADNW
jgi:hypothetical protein